MTSSVSNRVFGLSGSGIDVDAAVEKIMTAARAPYTKLGQQQTLVSWKKEAYNTAYKSIEEFRNNKVFNFQMKSTLGAKAVTTSNSSAVSATASGDAINVNHSISVSQLASGVTQSSTAKITTGTSKSTMAQQFGLDSSSFVVKVNGKEVTVNPTQSINELVTSINKAGAGVTASYDTTQDRLFLYTNATGASTGIDFTGSSTAGLNFITNNLKLSTVSTIGNAGITSGSALGTIDTSATLQSQFSGLSGTLNFNIYDGTTTKTLAIDTTGKSMTDLLTDINGLTNASGNQMAVASFANGKFTLKSAVTGTTLDLSGSDSNAINFMTQRLNLVNQQGQDAIVKLDGVNMTQSTNKFTVSGVTYNLQSLGSSTVGIQNDTDKIVSSVKTFISDYNTLLASLNTKVTEAKYKDYLPLTDEQKTAMEDSDITLWTEKAKSGLLRNDSTLKTLTDAMRSAFSTTVSGLSGTYKTASSIGISTGVDWTENGKLYLDEDKLKKALQEDLDAVYKIFGTTSSVTSENGIAVKLSKLLKTASEGIVKQAGITAATTSDITSVLGKEFKEYTTKMTAMNTKLIKKENQYYNQYAAMETALNKLSQQSSYVSSMLGE